MLAIIIFVDYWTISLFSIFFLAETTLALLRHPDYCISGYSSVSKICQPHSVKIIIWKNIRYIPENSEPIYNRSLKVISAQRFRIVNNLFSRLPVLNVIQCLFTIFLGGFEKEHGGWGETLQSTLYRRKGKV